MWTKEENRVYQRNWRRERMKDLEFRTKELERSKQWRRANVQKSRQWARDWHARIKFEVISHYCGGVPHCQCSSGLCSVVNIKFLTIDHPNNNGAEHRRQIGRQNLYQWLKQYNYPLGYVVLCWNCNCGRYHNKNVCPHTEELMAREDLAKS